MGAYNNLAGYARLRDRVYALFPRLKERRRRMAGTIERRRAADAGHRPGADERAGVIDAG